MPEQMQTWTKVCSFMQRQCAVVLRADQAYLLEPRLAHTAKNHKFGSIEEFVSAAVVGPAHSAYATSLIDAMTTHESYFFRDTSFWQFLEASVLPRCIDARAGGIHVWSAACSTGQEPYSLAMLLEERWPGAADKATIVATDISQEAIATSIRGVYSTTETNRGISAPRLVRHFSQSAGGFAVKELLRKRIRFQVANLMAKATPLGDCDVILCRNVLIYFSDADKKAVLRHLISCLRPGGYLGLGTSERCDLPALQPGWHQKP